MITELEHGDYMLLVKGAPDVLMNRYVLLASVISTLAYESLHRCSSIMTSGQSQAIELDQTAKERLIRVQESWAGNGQRVLLLARKTVKGSDIPKEMFGKEELADFVNLEINQNLTIVGLVGLVDPPKADIPETIATLRGAGIRVFMVTGDFALSMLASSLNSISGRC
jgi:sodium/potassium-transporting ATPase subunit alpha